MQDDYPVINLVTLTEDRSFSCSMSLPSDSLSLDTHTDSQLDFSLLSIANESENYSENVVEEFEYASQDIDGILLEIQGITNNNLK